MQRALWTVTLWTLAANPLGAKLTPEQLQKLPPPAAAPIQFSRDIKPIIEASCAKCHGRGKAKGGFKLDTRATFLQGGDSGPAALLGQSAESYLIELVSGLNPDTVMPVKGSKLTPTQVGLFRAWIDQGLPWDEVVSFARKAPLNLQPHRPALPAAGAGPDHPIDRVLEPYFRANQVKAAEPISDRLYARRVYLDAIGLLPPPDELEAFSQDQAGDKRPRLVERLLNDHRRYADHWLSFWNDLLRNDYRGTGYIDGGRKQISSWLHRVLAENMPYDRFVAALVDPGEENEGFIKGILWRGAVNASQIPEMQAAQNISQIFMGVNLKCASCHDSFINDWSLADAYSLASVFATNVLEMFECDKPTGKRAGVKFIYAELGDIPDGLSKAEKQRRLAEILTSKQNGRLARTIVNRLWQKCLGRGLVDPVDDMEQPAWHPDLLDWLAEDLAAHGYDLKRTLKLILSSRAYQRPAVSIDEQRHADYVFTGPAVRRMTAEQFRDALGQLTGVWHGVPAAQFDFAVGADEQSLAASLMPKGTKWIWTENSSASQAPAEMVYFWKTFTLREPPDEAFAAAACDNSYTLYVNGAKASSGKEWQTPNFADIRAHLREGRNVLAVVAANHKPDNTLPSGDHPARDQDANPAGFILYARIRQAGQTLDFGTDQSWVWSKEKKDGWEQPGFALDHAQPAAELGDPGMVPWRLERRLLGALSMALAHGTVRASLVSADALTVALGRPPREQVVTVRPSAATTLQALELTNGETLAKLLKKAADKVLSDGPITNQELANRLYARALSRKPTRDELKLADELLGAPAQKDSLEDFLWALAMHPEFQLIY